LTTAATLFQVRISAQEVKFYELLHLD